MWKIILEIIYEALGVAKKAIPPDEIRIDRHEEKKPLREQDANQELISDDFRYLKRRTEIDVWDYVRNTHPKMTPAEMALHHKILWARVRQFRYDNAKNPFVHRKIREWVKENPQK